MTLRRSWLSRFAGVIGFAIAQLLAVQLVLGGIVASRMAGAASLDAVQICSELGHGSADDGTSKPPAAIHPGFCAICAFASASVLPPVLQGMAPPPRVLVAAEGFPFAAIVPAEARTEPRLSQGPPSIV